MKNAFPSVGLLGALGLLLAVMSATSSTPLAAQEPARRPNVVVILGDDQAWTDYGFMGHAEIRTPHLDRLAASGLVFEHGYVPSSLCRPSLASIVTGLYPHEHGIVGNDPPKGTPRARMAERFEAVATLPELLAPLGYRSLQTGKWWEGDPRAHGFTAAMSHGDPSRGGRHGDVGLDIGRKTMQPIREFLDEVGSQPFFLWYAPMLPHEPHNPPERLLQRHLDAGASLPIARYHAMCEWFDETCGELLDELTRRQLRDDTLIVFAADNGWIQKPEARGYDPRSKRSPYDGGLRTPILVSWPGRAKARRVDSLASTVDLAPTILRAVGAEPPATMRGRDLLAIGSGTSAAAEQVVGSTFAHDVADLAKPAASLQYRWIRRGTFKLLVSNDGAVVELYDLAADSSERNNLATAMPERVAELRAHLDSWWNPTPEVPRKTSFLLITADDLGWESVGSFGGKILDLTPNLDTLAASGMRFAHAHVNIAVCQPCRQSLMTGRYPLRTGAAGFAPIAADVPTLQETLRAAGYQNGILGKEKHLQPAAKFCWDYVATERDLASGAGIGRSPERYREHTAKFLAQAKAAGKPFFLMANSHDPHRPFAGSAQERQSWADDLPVTTRVIAPSEVTVPGFLPDLPEVRQEIAEYCTSVYRCDQTVGAILAALRESGLEDDTVVMFLSDNGMAVPFAKANCYLASTRTPWLVRWPGKVAPSSVEATQMISGVDFVPTVLEAAGLPPLADTDGKSFVSVLKGRRQPGRDYVFTEFHETSAKRAYPMRAVQDRRFGYIYNGWVGSAPPMRMDSTNGRTFRAMQRAAAGDPAVAARVATFERRVPEELYDFAADPDGLVNLVDDPRFRDNLARLRALLADELTRRADPLAEAVRRAAGR